MIFMKMKWHFLDLSAKYRITRCGDENGLEVTHAKDKNPEQQQQQQKTENARLSTSLLRSKCLGGSSCDTKMQPTKSTSLIYNFDYFMFYFNKLAYNNWTNLWSTVWYLLGIYCVTNKSLKAYLVKQKFELRGNYIEYYIA